MDKFATYYLLAADRLHLLRLDFGYLFQRIFLSSGGLIRDHYFSAQ